MRQKEAMNYIISTILRPPDAKDGQTTQRLHMLLHGPGGCGKSVVVRAAAHVLRQSKKGCVIAAPTGVAAFNINGITLHQCCLLPVVNQSYGKACDMPQPDGQKLATLREIWSKVTVLFVDEISFVSSWMLQRLDQHLRLAKDLQTLPFGGLHVIFAGDLYQLPPPNGLPVFESQLWLLFQLCELEGNQRAARDPAWAALLARVRVGESTEADIQVLRNMVIKKGSSKRPAPKAVNLYATRQAVAESNQRYKEEHVLREGVQLHDCPVGRNLAARGHFPGQRWQEGIAASVPHRSRQGHHDPQKPGSHLSRRHPRPPRPHHLRRRSSLRRPEPLPRASALQLGAFQPQGTAVQHPGRVGLDQAEGAASRTGRPADVESFVHAAANQGFLRAPPG